MVNQKKSDTRILDSLIRYVKYTPKGQKIHISIFLMSYKPLINELLEANTRGVNIQLLIDNGREESESENKDVILQLLSAFRSPSKIVTFKSDASSTAINHDKYALFSKIELPEGVVNNVVFNTSHNFILAGTKKVQDAVVISHKELYNAFVDNWNDISSRAKSGMKSFTYKEVDLDSIVAYFYPRRANGAWDGRDTYIDMFDNISDYANASIRVVMSDWSRVEVAQKLTELQNKGAQVEVIAKDKADAGVLTELENLRAAGGYVKVIKMAEKNTHSKFVIVNATLDGKQQKAVFCGSHNFTYNALKNNNEITLKLTGSGMFNDYNRYFVDLKGAL